MNLTLTPPEEIIEATVGLPRSKSMTARALCISALCAGCAVDNPAECDDISALSAALASEAEGIDVGASGTALRLLTAVFAATEGRCVVLDGTERLRQRPVGPLVEALRSLGAEIEYLGEEGCAPLRITGRALEGGRVAVSGDISSQFLSALALIGPTTKSGIEIEITGENPVSLPYLDMTLAMMRQAGAEAERTGREVKAAGAYSPTSFAIEPDWSAATFLYEITAISGGFINTDPLSPASIQGDRLAAELFGSLGVNTDYEGEDTGLTELSGMPDVTPRLRADMSQTPDMVPALVVACVLLRVPFRLTGIATLRMKESDRIAALEAEIMKIGATLDTSEGPDILAWEGTGMPVSELPVFDPHGDHRLAMALAPIALFVPGIAIRDAEVVAKSWPEYWDALRTIGFTVTDTDEAQTTADEEE